MACGVTTTWIISLGTREAWSDDSIHEIDAWSDQDAKRIYRHFEADTFVLDNLGEALH